jgi:hypothetical protein
LIRNNESLQISKKFPMVLVSYSFYIELTNFLNDSNVTTFFIVVKLISALIPKSAWSRSDINIEKLKQEYPNEYGACVGWF